MEFDVLYNALNDISPITRELWLKIKNNFKIQRLNKGDYLFHAGDSVDHFYFLTSGIARYYYLDQNGSEFNKNFAFRKGHLLSSISSVVKGLCSPFSVEILTPFICFSIPYQEFLSLSSSHQEINFLLIKIYENLIIKKERREADFLLLDATQRYEKFLNEFSEIIEDIQNYHIASYLGISEVGLSRIRKNMGLT